MTIPSPVYLFLSVIKKRNGNYDDSTSRLRKNITYNISFRYYFNCCYNISTIFAILSTQENRNNSLTYRKYIFYIEENFFSSKPVLVPREFLQAFIVLKIKSVSKKRHVKSIFDYVIYWKATLSLGHTV